MKNISIDLIVSLAKRRGFIYQHDELYGGLGSVWDYGPYGALMKENIKRAFVDYFVRGRDDVILLDTAVLTKPEVLKASGHESSFSDPLVECKICHKRFRADEVVEMQNAKSEDAECVDDKEHQFTQAKQFNLMFKTQLGATEGGNEFAYLRPETAQGMFVNFANVLDSTRRKLPFGIAQIGRSFRNEITTGNFNFRAREFEIAEIEYFVRAGEDEQWFGNWVDEWERFLYSLGFEEGSLKKRKHQKNELAHYSKATTDLEYDFPFGRGEIAGIANRTDFDLRSHQKASGKSLEVFDPSTSSRQAEKYIPYVIEPTLGIDRVMLALLCDSIEVISGGRNQKSKIKNQNDNSKFKNEENDGDEIVLHLNPKIAPIQVAVLPLSKKTELIEPAKKIAQDLRQKFMVEYDETGSIGKRYRRQDEIGTPLGITFDFESIKDKKVTVRNRDTMVQDRVSLTDLTEFIQAKLDDWQ